MRGTERLVETPAQQRNSEDVRLVAARAYDCGTTLRGAPCRTQKVLCSGMTREARAQILALKMRRHPILVRIDGRRAREEFHPSHTHGLPTDQEQPRLDRHAAHVRILRASCKVNHKAPSQRIHRKGRERIDRSTRNECEGKTPAPLRFISRWRSQVLAFRCL